MGLSAGGTHSIGPRARSNARARSEGSGRLGPCRRPARDVILLEGIQVPAALGVTAAERRMRRPVRLDLEIARDLRAAGRSDSIRQTIHYKRVFEVVEDVAGNQQHKLVEALGDRIARAVLAQVRRRRGDGHACASRRRSPACSSTPASASRAPARTST